MSNCLLLLRLNNFFFKKVSSEFFWNKCHRIVHLDAVSKCVLHSPIVPYTHRHCCAVCMQTDYTTICTNTILVSGTTTVPLFIFLFLCRSMNLKMQRKLFGGAVSSSCSRGQMWMFVLQPIKMGKTLDLISISEQGVTFRCWYSEDRASCIVHRDIFLQ
jgi:hypothetical protein